MRPDIPGGSYEPSLPITEAVVNIAESSNITFADGSKKKTIKIGVPLTTADFAASTLGGHEVGGVAVMNASGEIANFLSLAAFAPQSEVTIVPYYKADNGETLLFGSNGFDSGSGTFDGNTKNITARNELIDGYAGQIIGYASAIAEGSAVRIKTVYRRSLGEVYTYYYTFKNYGDEKIEFTAYQMNAGDNVSGGDAVASEQISIEPGASKSITLVQVKNKNDDNAMTIIKFASALEHGVKLGATMSVEEKQLPAKITVRLPDGLTLDGSYKTDVMTGESLVLPKAEQIKGEGYGAPDGWYDANTHDVIEGEYIIYGDITIAPYWDTKEGYTHLAVGSGKNEGYNADQIPGDIFVNDKVRDTFTFKGKTHTGGNEQIIEGGESGAFRGAIVSDTAPVTAGSAIRFDSTFGVESSAYEFYYTVQNMSETEHLRLSVYQISASSEYKSTGKPTPFYQYESRYRVDIDLAPGEGVSKLGQYSLGSNTNAITYVVFEEDVNSFEFGISVSLKKIDALGEDYKNQAPLDNYVTIKYEASKYEGVTVNDGYLNQRVGRLILAPTKDEYTATGAPVIGWKLKINGVERDLPTTRVFGGLVLPSKAELELVPVLGAAENVATVTVDLPAGLTLEGYDNKAIIGGTLVTPTAAQIKGGGYGAPSGWYNVADDKIVGADFTVSGDITIAPYWNTQNGYTYLPFGSGANYGYNYDQTPGDFYDGSQDNKVRKSFTYAGTRSGSSSARAQLIKLGDNGTYLGSIVSDTAPVTAGSAIRLDSKYATSMLTAANNTKIAAGVYEFAYTVRNMSATDRLKLSIYQVSGSAEYKSPAFYQYESRYRVEIDLAPGESMTKLGQYDLGENGNALTYIVFEEDVDSFGFGISVGVKKVAAMDAAYKGQAPLNNSVAMTYDANKYSGVTVVDEYLSQRAGRLLVAPTSAQFTAPDGVVVTGWKIKIGNTEYDLPTSREFGGLRLPSKATVALIPQLLDAAPVAINFEMPAGMTLNGYDASAYKKGDALTLPTSAQINGADASGRAIAGWFDKATGKAIADGSTVTGDMTIAPYFAPTTTKLTPMYTTDNNPLGLDNESANLKDKFVKEADVVGGDEMGTRLTCGVDMAAGNEFRLKTKVASISKTNKYTFTYRFTNYGSSALKFDIYQVNSGITTTNMDGKTGVTIAAGETVVITLTLSGVDNNGAHALTYFKMKEAVSGFNLGIAMSMITEAL